MTHEPEADELDLANRFGAEDTDADDDTPGSDDSGADEPTYDVGGTSYTASELTELIGKGQDYTRKTQDLAEQRRELASDLALAENIKNWAESDPRALLEYVQTLTGQQSISEDVEEFEYLSDGERILHQQNQALERKLAAMEQQMANLAAGMTAGSVVDQIKSKYGLEVTSRDVQRAMQETGLRDPIKAFAAHRTDDIVAAAQKAAIAKVKTKPFTPTSDANTFNPDDPNLTADEIFRLMSNGAVPKV